MLHQEINLYRSFSTSKPHADFLSWKRFCQFQLFFLTLLCLNYLYSSWHLHDLDNQKIKLQSQVTQLQQKFMAIKQTYPPLFFAKDVAENLEAQKQLLQSLTTPIPFSTTLTLLSLDIAPNTWLTSITLTKGGNLVMIKGLSTDIDALQPFLEKLQHDKTLANFQLNVDQITRPDNHQNNNRMSFQLSLVNQA